VLLSDRESGPGVMFADMELIASRHASSSASAVEGGHAGISGRCDAAAQAVPLQSAAEFLNPNYATNPSTIFTPSRPVAVSGVGAVRFRRFRRSGQVYTPLSASVRAVLQRSVSDQAAPKLAICHAI